MVLRPVFSSCEPGRVKSSPGIMITCLSLMVLVGSKVKNGKNCVLKITDESKVLDDRLMNRDKLSAVGEGRLYLYVWDHLSNSVHHISFGENVSSLTH